MDERCPALVAGHGRRASSTSSRSGNPATRPGLMPASAGVASAPSGFPVCRSDVEGPARACRGQVGLPCLQAVPSLSFQDAASSRIHEEHLPASSVRPQQVPGVHQSRAPAPSPRARKRWLSRGRSSGGRYAASRHRRAAAVGERDGGGAVPMAHIYGEVAPRARGWAREALPDPRLGEGDALRGFPAKADAGTHIAVQDRHESEPRGR